MEESKIEADLLGFLSREVFPAGVALTADTELRTLGFDSMALVRLLLFIENSYGLWLPEKEIVQDTLRTPRTIAAAVFRLVRR